MSCFSTLVCKFSGENIYKKCLIISLINKFYDGNRTFTRKIRLHNLYKQKQGLIIVCIVNNIEFRTLYQLQANNTAAF